MHPPKPDPKPEQGKAAETEVDLEICALCDLVNDTYVGAREFVLHWRLEGEGE